MAEDGIQYLEFIGDTRMSDHVYVEQFIPRNHYYRPGKLDKFNQVAEYRWCNIAIKRCYSVPERSAYYL